MSPFLELPTPTLVCRLILGDPDGYTTADVPLLGNAPLDMLMIPTLDGGKIFHRLPEGEVYRFDAVLSAAWHDGLLASLMTTRAS